MACQLFASRVRNFTHSNWVKISVCLIFRRSNVTPKKHQEEFVNPLYTVGRENAGSITDFTSVSQDNALYEEIPMLQLDVDRQLTDNASNLSLPKKKEDSSVECALQKMSCAMTKRENLKK
eukprot:m.264110 g.264110  ORF g.264110 m.264110 type:complete len:121 (+) comp40464_c0_seq2:1813-2175(+)